VGDAEPAEVPERASRILTPVGAVDDDHELMAGCLLVTRQIQRIEIRSQRCEKAPADGRKGEQQCPWRG
jgi:hypothetical protein